MSYFVDQHLTTINKGKKGLNKPEYIVVHFVGASGQAPANALFFASAYRGSSAHYFIDPLKIIQVVEDDTPAWHIGDGKISRQGDVNGYVYPGGATNNNSIGIELCQDVTTGEDAWSWEFHPDTVEKAVWLIKNLQKRYGIDDDHVIRHFDATGKPCPGNWMENNWAKWWEFKDRLEKNIIQLPESQEETDEGKREEVGMYTIKVGDTLSGISRTHNVALADLIKWNNIENPDLIFPESKLFVVNPDKEKEVPVEVNIKQMALDTMAGKYGNGDERKKNLGIHYSSVQSMVNSMVRGNIPEKTIDELATEVIRGLHGSGRERMISLGDKYAKVQKEVNRRLRKGK